jgi:anti-sigma factor RsiW
MQFLTSHADGLLEALAAGELPERRRKRVLRHMRQCERCAQRYEQLVRANRALAGLSLDEPSPQELATLRAANLKAALGAAAPARRPVQRGVLGWAGALAGGVAALIALVVVRPSDSDEWQARGEAGHRRAVLRVFCVRPNRPVVELETGAPCPPGASLAFAVGAVPPLRSVRIAVEGRPASGPLAILGAPGKEQPVSFSFTLEGPVGTREVVATFEEENLVLRHLVRVEPDP